MKAKDFETLFRQLYVPLGMYAMRIVDNPDDAEDLVEESFLNAWNALEDGKEIDNFKAYIYRLVRNQCVSFLRKNHLQAAEKDIPEVTDEAVDTSERDARIWKAIDSLPEKCREIFLMSKRDGLSNQEIAEELDISIKTVKNQMTKALSRLRDALADGHKPFFLPFL